MSNPSPLALATLAGVILLDFLRRNFFLRKRPPNATEAIRDKLTVHGEAREVQSRPA
jgi:hypothetical protein